MTGCVVKSLVKGALLGAEVRDVGATMRIVFAPRR
jgi:hypothetical protein